MNVMERRLRRLENRQAAHDRRIIIQYGHLKTLPREYTGPRHTVTVRELPPDELGRPWFEWEERPGPGPEPDAAADCRNGEHVIQVCFVPCANWPLPVRRDEAHRLPSVRVN